nr:glutamate receptor 2.8-like [Ipomoea batatas]
MKISRFFLPFLLKVAIITTFYTRSLSAQNSSAVKVDVGVILDLKTESGKMRQTCISLALADFYASRDHRARIFPHFRDSNNDDVDAASAAIGLLRNDKVQAILGPQMSTQADFVIDIGKKVKVPILSPATSPALSPNQSSYFIRVAQSSRAQVKAIAAIVKAFGWRQVVFIYENSNFGSGVLPHLTDAMVEVGVSVPYRSILQPSAEDDEIITELYKLMTMQTRVFVVHLLPTMGSRLFQKAKDAGMMSQGYVWIITDAFTNVLDSMDPTTLDNMEGVIGVKPYVKSSIQLKNFTRRWRKKFYQENPDAETAELDVFGLWAYDSITALAMAFERVDTAHQNFTRAVSGETLTDLDAIGTSDLGPSLIKSIRNIRLRGLSGDFHIVDGELQPSAFQIVNVNGRGKGIGFWTEEYGISKKLKPNDRTVITANRDDLGISWPGDSNVVPKGWEIPTNEKKKLRIGVPSKGGLEQFVKVTVDPQTNRTTATGFCIDVFEEVIRNLPYAVPFDYIPFSLLPTQNLPDYDDFVDQINLGNFDAVVGDVTILADRSEYVEFSLPFTESGVTTVVPVKQDMRKSAWIFLRPLRTELWVTTGAFLIFIGFVIWVLEHGVNKEFQGPRHKQVGMIFWFSFSTLVYAHREKVISNLSRFVIIVWVFVVLVLTSSYTASLTSMLTVQQLQPTITNVEDLIKNQEPVGYQDGSFVKGLLKKMKFDSSKFLNYSTLEQYDEALTKGSQNGGVAAIVDELPYIRLFLAKYCGKYTMIGPTYKTAGFGFAFPIGSPLVPDISRAVLSVMESESMMRITDKWFRNETDCSQQDRTLLASDSLPLDSFKGIFLIAGASASSALLIFFFRFLNQNKEILESDHSTTWQKICALATVFYEGNGDSPNVTEKPGEGNESVVSPNTMPDTSQPFPQTIIAQSPGVFTYDEGFMSTEPPSPDHDTILVTESAAAER